MKDLLLACVFNMQLKQVGICEKYLHEMTDAEGRQYYRMVAALAEK